MDQGVLTEAQANQIDAEIAAEVKAAEDFARTSPFPAPEEALAHVFA